MNPTPNEIILNSANWGIKYLQKHDHMPAGHNGPYIDKETPVRNSAHWGMIFLKAYQLTDDKIYLDQAKKCVDFLCKHLDENGYFVCRHKVGKDTVNGLIGQAWAMEPIIELNKFVQSKKSINLVKSLINAHSFDKHKGLWKTFSQDNESKNYDYTFNHQLWFASVCSDVEDDLIRQKVVNFINKMHKNIVLHGNGRIGQSIYQGTYETTFKHFVKSIIRKKDVEYMRLKEIGYHAFNTYGFIRLYRNFPTHKFWSSKKFERIISYLTTSEYKSGIFVSKYGFKYNPPAFEIYATQKNFGKVSLIENSFIESIWNYQIKNSWDSKAGILSNGSFDSNTNIARAYECCECIDV